MWIILLSIVAAVVVTYLASRNFGSKKSDHPNDVSASDTVADADCCGAHEVCDKETLLSSSDEIVYYQDEELDQYRGIPSNGYNTQQIESFREVLYTMRDDEVAGWLRSLQLRNINPPNAIREEALMIVSDVRDIIRGSKQFA
jgi:hypothetical protein